MNIILVTQVIYRPRLSRPLSPSHTTRHRQERKSTRRRWSRPRHIPPPSSFPQLVSGFLRRSSTGQSLLNILSLLLRRRPSSTPTLALRLRPTPPRRQSLALRLTSSLALRSAPTFSPRPSPQYGSAPALKTRFVLLFEFHEIISLTLSVLPD